MGEVDVHLKGRCRYPSIYRRAPETIRHSLGTKFQPKWESDSTKYYTKVMESGLFGIGANIIVLKTFLEIIFLSR